MKELNFNFQSITGNTKVVGVMGDPIAHTLSPAMHNAAFAALDLDYIYLPFHVRKENLKKALEGVVAMGLVGVNLTIPLKVEAVTLMDSLAESAKLLGAVNTVVNKDGHLEGYNTDGEGFWFALEQQVGVKPTNKRILVIGAGGSAHAIAIHAGLCGSNLLGIAVRNPQKGEELVKKLRNIGISSRFYPLSELTSAVTESYDIIVHTTQVGMHPKADVDPLLSEELLHSHNLVCDIVYNPRQTSLLRAAKIKGCQTLSGEGMLVCQGALAFELWTGKKAPIQVMLDVLHKRLDAKE